MNILKIQLSFIKYIYFNKINASQMNNIEY
jgi:hypothetical protein